MRILLIDPILWDDANSRLYVLMSGGTTTLFTYTYNGTSYGLNTTSTLPSMEPGEGRAAIYKSPNGNLWASMMDSDGLFVARSIDDGVSWQGRAKLHNPVAEGQTQLAHFGNQVAWQRQRTATTRKSLSISSTTLVKATTPGTQSPTPQGR